MLGFNLYASCMFLLTIMRAFCAALMLGVLPSLQADVITLWDFNSVPPDSTTSTGTLIPSSGSGSAMSIGEVTASFSTGGGSDPASSTDDSSWSTAGYPGVMLSNKTAGVEFRVSTSDYTNIAISWDQRHSATASRYMRFQYSLDGSSFIDGPVLSVYEDSVFTNQVVNLAGIPAAANNPNFAFRIVSEFVSTATGAGTNDYRATKEGSGYATGGTIRFEMVKVQGTLLPGANTPPWILASPANQTLRVTELGAAQTLTILDAEDSASTLRVRAESSNPAVIPVGNITFGGSAAYRTVTVRAASVTGSSLITLYVSDPGNRTNTAAFLVTVIMANTPPFFLSSPSTTNTLVGASPLVLPFRIADLESSASVLTIAAFSSNATVLPPGGIAFGGAGTNRTITLTPAATPGVVPVTIAVSDGPNKSYASFALMVLPHPDNLFWDDFDYPASSLSPASGGLYDTRSGTPGDLLLSAGQVLLLSTNTEDVVAPLAGGPVQRSNNAALYASFTFRLLGMPKTAPAYFAHLVDGNTLRARIFVGTSNAPAGFFRLYVANGSDNCSPNLTDLETNTTYTAVWRYEIDTASTRLWINPDDENSPSALAVDPVPPLKIGGVGLRQDSGLGTGVVLDNLRAGRTFASVTGAATAGPRLTAAWSAGQLMVTWETTDFSLQAAPSPTGAFTNVPGASSPYFAPLSNGALFFRLKAVQN